MSDGTGQVDTLPPPITPDVQGEQTKPAEQQNEPGMIDKAKTAARDMARRVRGIFTKPDQPTPTTHEVVTGIAKGDLIADTDEPVPTAKPLTEKKPDEVVAAAETFTKDAIPDTNLNIAPEDTTSATKTETKTDGAEATSKTTPESPEDVKDEQTFEGALEEADKLLEKAAKDADDTEQAGQDKDNTSSQTESETSTASPADQLRDLWKSGATKDEIKRLHRRLSRQLHPDINPNLTPEQLEQAKELNDAYTRIEADRKTKSTDTKAITQGSRKIEPPVRMLAIEAAKEPTTIDAETTENKTEPTDKTTGEPSDETKEQDEKKKAILDKATKDGLSDEQQAALADELNKFPDLVDHITDLIDQTDEARKRTQEDATEQVAAIDQEDADAAAKGEVLPPKRREVRKKLLTVLAAIAIIVGIALVGTAMVTATAGSMGGGRR